MIKNILLGALMCAVLLLCGVISYIENERYALLIGACPSLAAEFDVRSRLNTPQTDQGGCLRSTQTRTSPLWHIYYAIKDTYF